MATILLVANEVLARTHLEALLTSCGHEVTSVRTDQIVDDRMNTLRSGCRYDVIISAGLSNSTCLH